MFEGKRVAIQRDARGDPLFITRRRLANVHAIRSPLYSILPFANVPENEVTRAFEGQTAEV
jgi:hypothetical protein